MSGRPGGTDPLDALIDGDRDELADEDRRLADLVDHLFVAYMPADEPRRTLLLRRFTDFGTAVLETSSPRRRRVAAAVALAGTVTGKLVLGGAVAVAAVGGLHVTDTVQVPLLPEVGTHDDSDVDADLPALLPDASGGSTADPASPDPSASPATSSSAPTPAPVDSGPNVDPPTPTVGDPTEQLPPDVTIPAPTVPPTTRPVPPPTLDPDVQPPTPTLPDSPR